MLNLNTPFGNCNCIEDEIRVHFECPLYQYLRRKLQYIIDSANRLGSTFNSSPPKDKLKFVITCPQVIRI